MLDRPGTEIRQGSGFRLTNRLRVSIIALLTVLLLAGWSIGLVIFVRDLPTADAVPAVPLPATRTDAIVVLTGGSNRLQTGMDLLNQAYGQKLFVTGVYRGVEVQELLRLARNAPSDLECCIELDYEADDTVENAAETARWMQEQGFTSLRLVTSNYHMPRSLLEFRMADPNLTIMPHAIAPATVSQDGWWRQPRSFGLYATEYTKYLLTRARFALYQPG
ncbi:MAG: YdcF family protein [Alphaproteobacteria bacterium]|nr:YdcF family protein [Alphaproteobacteria bacterium SS10]